MGGKPKIVRFLRFLHQFLGKLELLKKLILQDEIFHPVKLVFLKSWTMAIFTVLLSSAHSPCY